MEIPASIFREYDIRGVVGRDLTPARVEAIGRAIGSEARAQGLSRLAVARDGRLSGPELVQALRNGLRATGCAVLDVGMVPTPTLYFAIHHLHADGGVMLTGSHNPPNYNGFKMVLGGRTLHGAAIQQIHERIRADDFWVGPVGDVENDEILPAYVQRIVGDVHLARRLRIGMDCGSGVTGVVAPELFRALGCEVHGLFTEVDGHFPHHHPDPSEEKNLQDLIRLVAEQGLDLGLAFDGDGDRLGVVAPGGEIIWADRQMILFAQDVLSRVPGAPIIFDVKCSHFLPEAIRAAGGVPLMWKTGHSLIKAKMAEMAAPLAGEMSGHIFFKERWYGFDDGLYAGARLLEILSRRAEAPGAVLRALPKGFSTPELRVELAEGEHFALMEWIRAEAAQRFPDATLITLDGVRVELADAWGLVRASNTQPVLVLRFEGDSAAALAGIQGRFRELLQAVKPGVILPF
jgi:phosphomannomutase/phosphoglucomutase